MVSLRRGLAVLGFFLVAAGVRAVDVSAILETRLQVDNRFNRSARVLGEVWGDADLAGRDWQLHASWVGRMSSLPDDSGGRLYQGFLAKRWPWLNSVVRLGRFQRADVAGLYLLDGAQWDYQVGGWQVQWYGGRPVRLDHVRSVQADFAYGVNLSRRETVDWSLGGWRWSGYRLGVGFQGFRRNGDPSRRLQARGGVYGTWGSGRVWEVNLAAVYRFDRRRFEDVWFQGFVDLPQRFRFRGYYEYYRPRAPFPTFRERFVSAYALGEQSLLRLGLERRPKPSLRYFVVGQRATRADGFDGYGIRAGGDVGWRDHRWSVVYDYLEIGYDDAHSAYGQWRYVWNSRLESRLNVALRRERKLLYGDNWARGGEVGLRYLFSTATVVDLSVSYVANSRRRDDYVGAVRLVYYFDRFRPKQERETCAASCW